MVRLSLNYFVIYLGNHMGFHQNWAESISYENIWKFGLFHTMCKYLQTDKTSRISIKCLSNLEGLCSKIYSKYSSQKARTSLWVETVVTVTEHWGHIICMNIDYDIYTYIFVCTLKLCTEYIYICIYMHVYVCLHKRLNPPLGNKAYSSGHLKKRKYHVGKDFSIATYFF